MIPTVSVAIMAHRKREAFVPDLLAKLDRPAQVVWDRRNDRWDTGRRAMLAHDPGASHHLVVQDDAVIPRDLVAGIERALTHVPAGSPLCLYCGRARPLRAAVEQLVGRTNGNTSWLTMSQLHWGVGIVMPTKLIEPMVAWCDRQVEVANYDKRISRWCQTQRLTVCYPWPSLVDHRDSPSLVEGRGSAGRYAYRFIGEDASALGQRYDGKVVSIPLLSRHMKERRMDQRQLQLLRRRLKSERQRMRTAQTRIAALEKQISAAERADQPSQAEAADYRHLAAHLTVTAEAEVIKGGQR